MSMANRVENEVAIISLASAALSGLHPAVVPRVYGWGSAAGNSEQGWILQELMPGSPLDAAFDAMALEQKRKIFAQMAEVLTRLQTFQLPESITDFGGVTFDNAGQIVSAEMPTVGAGPWDSYEASFKGRLEVALRKADANPYIKGWHANGLRKRIDRFVAQGLPAQFEDLGSKEDRVVVHADFSQCRPRQAQIHTMSAANHTLLTSRCEQPALRPRLGAFHWLDRLRLLSHFAPLVRVPPLLRWCRRPVQGLGRRRGRREGGIAERKALRVSFSAGTYRDRGSSAMGRCQGMGRRPGGGRCQAPAEHQGH